MLKPSFSKLDVLVVDPSPHMASLVAQMLRHLKVRRADEATDADRAAALLQSHRYGAIIMNDVLMPSDGISVVRALRQASAGLNRDTPVVMMATSPEASRIEEARDAGITEFLRKPFAARDVEMRLAAMLAAPRPFIDAADYAGPDRRRRRSGYKGANRRH
jgi:CheY-like chemotaxis protein